jgi:hypothetical protein
VLRWLLPLLAAVALLGQSVMAYAGAGMLEEVKCCCPVKATCKCHDHGGKVPKAPVLKRCTGTAKVVAAAPVAAVAPSAVEIATPSQITASPVIALAPLPDDVSYEPETPPF